MKNLFTVILTLFFTFQCFSQKADGKSILFISTQYFGEKCEHVAFKVSNNKVEIDSCYDFKSKIFDSQKIISIDEEPTLKVLFKKSTDDLKDYEKEINATNCDSIVPIILIINENDKETVVSWEGIRNCYPERMRRLVEDLEKLFVKYK